MKIRSISIATALFIVAPLAAGRAQATGKACNDGTMSAAVGKGACSGHGGVKTATKASKRKAKSDTKMSKPTTKMARAETKMSKPSTKMEGGEKMAKPRKTSMSKAADKDGKDATAECKDHTYSHAPTHTGACSGHGGVLKFLK